MLKLCEATVGRADATLAFVQMALALLAAGGAFVVIRTHMAARELSEQHDKVMQRAEDIRSRAESLLAELRAAANAAKKDISNLVAKGESSIGELRKSAAELLGTVQAEAEQRLRAAEEMARQSATAQPLAGSLGRQERWALAQVLISTGNLERGAELLRTVAQDDLATNSPDINVLNQLSGILDRLGRYLDAVRYADIAIEQCPGDVGAWFNRAVIEIHLGGASPDVTGKRRHWQAPLMAFDEARRQHAAGNRMTAADYGKMWLFAGETAEYLGELGSTPEGGSDWLQKAAAWYNEGYVWLLDAQRQVTEDTTALISFWLNNAHERTLKIHHLDRQSDAGLGRKDIALLGNDLPFWRKEDEQGFASSWQS
jgi:tetratricopeptide (TPR) repeat protein